MQSKLKTTFTAIGCALVLLLFCHMQTFAQFHKVKKSFGGGTDLVKQPDYNINGKVIAVGQGVDVRDQWYVSHPTPANCTVAPPTGITGVINSSSGYLTLKYLDSKRVNNKDKWYLRITYDITYETWNGTSLSSTTQTGQTIDIYYDPTNTGLTKDIQIKKYAGAVRMLVSVQAIAYCPGQTALCGGPQTSIPKLSLRVPDDFVSDFVLDVEVESDKYITMGASAMTTFTTGTTANNQLMVNWGYVPGAQGYDLEWVFVDDYTMASTSATYDFANATRVNVRDHSYNIPLIYPAGHIIWRLRPVTYTNDAAQTKIDGTWSLSTNTGNVSTLGTVHKKVWAGVDLKKNWQYSSTFAEDGKRKEVINYFDGSLRQRQAVTLVNSDTNVIVQETKYDFQGRPAMNMMPSPLASSGIKYYTGVYNAASALYDDKKLYDASTTLLAPTVVNNSAGAAKYYSSSPTVTDINTGFLPDAGGYVFSRTMFMNDGTGRVKSQSSPGQTLAPSGGSDKRVKYFYGKPTSQTEIDALFGNEVGALSHYNKQMTIDQNGQASYTFTDMHGRTIATCISGVTPTNLLGVDNKPSAQTVTDDLLDNNNLLNNSNEFTSTTSLMVDAAQTYTLSYDLDPGSYCGVCSTGVLLDCTSGTSGAYCKDCSYAVTLSITDDEGNYVSSVSFDGNTNGTSATYNNTNPLLLTGVKSGTYSVAITLQPGAYVVTKTLKPEPITSTVQNDPNFISGMASCITTPQVSIAGCASDCNSACEQVYTLYNSSGAIIGYVDDNRDPVEHDSIGLRYINWCKLACNNNATANNSDQVPDECERKLMMIKEDMSPSGQYFDNLTNSNVANINDWLNTNLGVGTAGSLATNISNFFTTITNSISVTYVSWNDMRTNWDDRVLNCSLTVGGTTKPFFQWHPEYTAYDFFCGTGMLCTGAQGTANYTQMSNSYDMVTANIGTTQMDPTNHVSAYEYFNPLKSATSTANPQNYCPTTYSNTASTTTVTITPPYTNYWQPVMNSPDPITLAYGTASPGCVVNLCATGGTGQNITINSSKTGLSSKVPDVLEYNMFHFLEFTGAGGVNTYTYSLWYILEDPASIHTQAVPTTTDIPDHIIKYFQSIHGDGTNPGMIDPNSPITKYNWFRGQYQMLKQYLIYKLFKVKFSSYTHVAMPGNGLSVTNPYFAPRFPENAFYRDNMDYCVPCTTNSTCPQPWGKINYNPATVTAITNTVANTYTAAVVGQCSTDCQNSAADWMKQLEPCGIVNSGNTATTYANIESYLIQVCQANCHVPLAGATTNTNVVNGSSGCPSGTSSSNYPTCTNNFVTYSGTNFYTFDDVTTYFINAYNTTYNPDITCVKSIYYPPTSPLDPSVTQDVKDGLCGCGKLNYYITNSADLTQPMNPFDNTNANCSTIVSAINTAFSITTTTANVAAWITECNKWKPSLSALTTNSFPTVFQCSPISSYNRESCTVERFQDFLNAIGIPWKSSYNTAPSSSDPDIVLIGNKLRLFVNVAITNTNVYNWMTNASGLFATTPSISYLTSNGFPSMFVCPPPASTSQQDINAAIVLANCQMQSLLSSASYAVQAYSGNLGTLANSYASNYNNYCVQNILDKQITGTPLETFTVKYNRNQFLYTLYYYDQAGDLIKTVPPQGVVQLTSTLANVKAYRNNPTGNTPEFPLHSFITKYKYDFQDKILQQSTPDGGITKFYYDAKHQLVVSQNAKQNPLSDYSYTNYDGLGRITEVGQLEPPTITVNNDVTLGFDAANQSVLNGYLAGTGSKTQITRTYYDKQNAVFGTGGTFGMTTLQNLRNRVAQVTLSATGTSGYESATHYNYDIHGNVVKLYQENNDPQLAVMGHTVKIVDYKFDVISGKVNEVHYQGGYADQFHHKYWYDADNRLRCVETSPDGYLYRKEAKYFYYPHGPVSRVELGDKQVQGSDYAYTLQGWLKGVNATTLMMNRDMGIDGLSRYVLNNISATSSTVMTNSSIKHLNANFGGDAFGYGLDYYIGDYTPVNVAGTVTGDRWQLLYNTSNNTMYNNHNTYSLYNGNISAMTNAFSTTSETAVSTLARLFKYDQLNRIRVATNYAQTGVETSNEWTSSAADATTYNEEFHYDFNGNINTVQRYGNAGLMDNLSYTYTPGNTDNKLMYVNDAVASGTYANIDFDTHNGLTKLLYDPIGNLEEDRAQDIDKTAGGLIDWNVYGKIRSIRRNTTSTMVDLDFKYDPQGNRIAKIEKTKQGSGALKNQNDWVHTYYVRDAQGNTLATYDMSFTAGATDVYNHNLKLEEVPMYGSSRLGYYDHAFAETKAVNVVPGSNFVNNLFNYANNSTGPQGQVTLTAYERILGNKKFELSNHLGNVLSVVSDMKLGSQNKQQSILEGFEYTLNSITTDKRPGSTGYACDRLYTPTTSTFTPKNYHYQCFGQQLLREVKPGDLVKVNLWVKNPNDAPGIYVIIDFTNENGAYIVDNASGFGLWYSRDLKQTCPTCTTWAQIDFPLSSSGGTPVPVLAQSGGAYYIQLPLSGITNPGGGTKYFARVSVWNSNLTASNDAYLDDMEMTVIHDPQNNQGSPLTELDHYTANVTSSQDYFAFGQLLPGRNYTPDGYRYGFNGQEKDDEITDVTGATNTAMFWEYDTRLGRRWNMDPKPTIGISDYAVFGNNPIANIDILGDRWKNKHDDEVKNATGKKEAAQSTKDQAASKLGQLKASGASEKEIAKAQKTVNKAIARLSRAQKDLSEVTAKKEFVDGVLAKLKETNPDWYNYWETWQVGKIDRIVEVSSQTTLIGDKQATEATTTVMRGGYYDIIQKLYMPVSFLEKSSSEQVELIKSRSFDSAHGVGHGWLKMSKFAYSSETERGEANADEYGHRVIKNVKIWDIHNDNYLSK